MKIPFSPPDISNLEIEEVVDTLKSGWITTGPKTKKFEQMIGEFIGNKNVVCLNSQTACQEMALRVMGIGKGDEVITSAYTYSASASVIDHIGAKIVFVDLSENSLEMDYDALESAITEKTKAIIPVDIAGIPCNYDKIFEIVERKKGLFKANSDMQKALGRIAVMADCAHSLGASVKGVMAGNIADFSSFSFHAVKNLTTGEGGACSWKSIDGISDEDIYKQFQLLSLHGQNKDARAKMQPGAWEYDIISPLYKCNMTDIMAAIGIGQLKRYNGMLNRRREMIEKLDNALRPLGVNTLNHYTDNYLSSGHLYITRVPNIDGKKRNEIIIKMAEMGVSCNVHYKPLPMMTAYKNLGFDIKDYPNSYKMYENEITLPLNTTLTDEMVDYIIECYTKVIKEMVL